MFSPHISTFSLLSPQGPSAGGPVLTARAAPGLQPNLSVHQRRYQKQVFLFVFHKEILHVSRFGYGGLHKSLRLVARVDRRMHVKIDWVPNPPSSFAAQATSCVMHAYTSVTLPHSLSLSLPAYINTYIHTFWDTCIHTYVQTDRQTERQTHMYTEADHSLVPPKRTYQKLLHGA